ncbi:MAG: ATP-binding protein [Candidatus Omnitrophica bacterium]|nr:ATP-binding protein [Candidatus Omnitrophota bacterium]
MAVQGISESIKMPSDIKKIRKVIARIVDLLVERNVDKSHMFDIRLSVEEAIINAIEHGNKKDKNLIVDISFAIDDEKIEVAVEDQGGGFDHTKMPDPTTNGNVLRAHGRGVYLIHKLMDRVQYNDRGNRIKLIKYLR